ncbi:MAG TPA: Asd/ArgC dimerization domain-containing protein [Candidatus Methylomirabilis sp.]|nr:Asd/ArgC dimerization domain-containing protein [Candidatus Methylomirabilis sp.]
MPALDRGPNRIVIAGASSLLGAELKALLEESRFAGWDLELVDEEVAAGTLTEAGGEPAVIQPVEEATFDRARFVFFTGSAEFTEINLGRAREAGSTIIDLSGAALGTAQGTAWFSFRGAPNRDDKLFMVPSAAGTIAAHLLDSLGKSGLCRLGIVFFRPVSETGRSGIEELETQTSQLLSFQGVGQAVFDTQVAFALLNRYGSSSRQSLNAVQARIRREIVGAVGKDLIQPSIQVVHAPVFYGYTFSAIAELNSGEKKEMLGENLKKAGILVEGEANTPLGNLTASGESAIHIAVPEPDPSHPGTWWIWGAADNIRLPAWNAVKLAEMLA